MLAFYHYADGRLSRTADSTGCQLIQLVRPSPAEVEQIQALTQAPADLLSAATDRDERPRMESEDSCRLLIIRIPHHDPLNSDLPYLTMAFGIVLTPRYTVTVCSEDSIPWSEIVSGQVRAPDPRDRIPFLCFAFMRFARQFLNHLSAIRREADDVESAIHLSLKNQMVIRMLNLEKCLVDFTTSLRGNELIWERLPRICDREPTEDEQDAINDVQVEFRQAKDLADLHSNILSGMMDAFASIISNNLSVIIKVLTSVTIILMLPTLVASVYGMNVPLPFQESPHAFAITMTMSVIVSIAGLVVFWKLRWF